QVREKIGVFFGNPETTPGGRALKFYASVRLEARKIDSIKKGTEIVGNRIKVKIVKNKVAPPFKETELDIYYGQGVSKESSLIEAALNYGVFEKKGSYFSYEGKTLGQGLENIIENLRKNPTLFEEIEKKVREKAGLIKKPVKKEGKE
ncbi:MAG: DNA recombination/repair protein RecA, partial [Candidatus Omnitrophica bacterium]|nr:DNA recombination/repair protein RecA [Candidatus Omnitrophota bacterium]